MTWCLPAPKLLQLQLHAAWSRSAFGHGPCPDACQIFEIRALHPTHTKCSFPADCTSRTRHYVE
eukprot:932682-Amphidinium_carterae.2